jgi:uncharacterized protein YjbI with pentapeptide repeats
LRGADLSQAYLNDVDLSGADLSEANLEGAIISDEQLSRAQSLKDAILPDGTRHLALVT